MNRVLKATDFNGAGSADDIVTRYSYDMLSRVPKQGWGENAGSALWEVTTAFDESGRQKTVDYPVGAGWNATTLSYDYDALSRLTAVNDLGANPVETVSAFQYVGSRMIERGDSDGSLWTAAIDSATTRWDKAGRRTGAKVTAGATTFFEESLFYDADDRVTRVEWSRGLPVDGTAAQVYSYDELSRLVNFEQGPWNGSAFSDPPSTQHKWTLDEQGNWNKHSDQDSTPGVDWAPPVDNVNAYTSWPTRVDYNRNGTIESNEKEKSLSLSYDAARAFLYEREESQGQYLLYRHDALGRLSTISRRIDGVEKELVRYGYTADGRLAYRYRIPTPTILGEELYLISDGDHVIIERTASATQRTYIWAGATLLKSRDTGGVELHLYQDRLGSVVLAMKREPGSTSMHGRAQYDPYGNNISNTNWDGDGVGQPYGYTGARWDSLAGLYLMGARWYAPEMGRFVELDPIGEGGGWNLYNYVGSSPTMWVDPTGLKWEGAGPPAVAKAGLRLGERYMRLMENAVTRGQKAMAFEMGSEDKILCHMCNNADETGDSGATDEETSDEQESGATEEPGVGITPAEGEDPEVVGKLETQIEQAIGMPITKGEDGRYRRGQGPVTEKKQAALDAFDNAAQTGVDIKAASWSPDGLIDNFDTQTVYVDVLGRFPNEGEAKSTHAITQEEIVTHVLAEYSEGTRRGFTTEIYKNGAHAAGLLAQNDYRKANGRVGISGGESTLPWKGVFKAIWGPGRYHDFGYTDGATSQVSVWPGGFLAGSGFSAPGGWR